MKTDLEKVESVQYHMDRIEEYLNDCDKAEMSFITKRSELADRMLREVDYLDKFLCDKDICDKVCDDLLCKIKEAKERVDVIAWRAGK
jgi:hypothetical protein